MTTINRLAGAAFGIHFADQIALVSVPLVAALVFDAPAETIGILVACQSLAHLLGSLPFGVLVDRSQLRTLVLSSTLISFAGFLAAAASIFANSLFGFAIAVTFSGFGVVLFTLSALSIVPLTVASNGLARANATIEIPRTISLFIVPLSIGILIAGV
ncbi:MAG: MFS transporter, partial [Rhizobiaceae bacterium]|nr:MFS transporter [Rhizobiaceae bacterium]